MTSDTLEKIDRARVVVAELNYGKREWKGLHEPASEDATDVVVMEALRCAALEISRLIRELEEVRSHARRVVVALRAIRDEAAIGGPPLESRREDWEAAMDEADEVLGELEALYGE